MKKIISIIIMLMSLMATANAAGVNVPFTDSRITFFETWHVIDIEPRQSESSSANTYRGEPGEDVRYVGSSKSDTDRIYVGDYTLQYRDLIQDYRGQVFRIQTDKRTLQGYIEGDYLIEDFTRNPDYTIKVESEDEFYALVQEFRSGRTVSLLDIEKQVSMPLKIRYSLIKYGIFN